MHPLIHFYGINKDIKFTSGPLIASDFDNVTQTVAMCLMVDPIGLKGEYYCHVNG
ncbi:hypothetical protein ACP4OV_031754 [Aristida adscensionis]